jgi:hypothetical protein
MERTWRLVIFLLPVNDGCLEALSWTRRSSGKDTICPKAFLYSVFFIITLANRNSGSSRPVRPLVFRRLLSDSPPTTATLRLLFVRFYCKAEQVQPSMNRFDFER